MNWGVPNCPTTPTENSILWRPILKSYCRLQRLHKLHEEWLLGTAEVCVFEMMRIAISEFGPWWLKTLKLRERLKNMGTNFQTVSYPTFFLLQLNPTYMKRILHLVSVKNITFKSSYNWLKIDIHQQLRPLTANYLAMFKVISTTIYT